MEYDAKRAKRLRPIAAALLWIDTTYHLAHIEALAMNAEFDRAAHDISNLVVACKKCNTRKAAKEFVQWLPLVAEGRRKLVADWYARKHGAQPEQIGLRLLMAA